ncbi:uncharacterized protein [Misgurnus anguillicaudatus]|uniref:uncharacterized protein isoform X1 n=3 Tax=Misgurnus anguillicaudatus TaxID=75329 RepID=UPI003CCF0ACF
MNWVGGSRSRFMKHKEDTIKQRAFFQKQRMKKFKNVDPQTSPNENNAANVDLLTLFIVNQIASKKKHNGKPKMNFFNANETKTTLNEALELPMSPCSPSNLDLVTSQPQYSAHDSDTVDTHGFNIRKHCISKEFKFKPLSPLLESNLSDLSGSENQPHIQNTISPFPPTTGSSESFHMQPGPSSHVSSSLPCRENSDSNSTKFELFSQPMTSANAWTDVSGDANGLQNSSVADILFGITLPNTDTAEQSAYSGLYPASPLKSSEQLEEPLFIDFTNRDHKENPYAEKTTNIFLETSFSSSTRVQRNSEGSENMDRDGHFLAQNKSYDGNGEKNAPVKQDAETQTAAVPALSCCDVSVQCSLIQTGSINSISFPTGDYKTGSCTTRRQSVHFNEMPSGATKEKAQTHPKATKELKIGQLLECRVKERCEDQRFESVMRNPVKGVRRAEDNL